MNFHDLAWPLVTKEPLHCTLKQSGHGYRFIKEAGNKEEVLHASFGAVLRSKHVQKTAELIFC